MESIHKDIMDTLLELSKITAQTSRVFQGIMVLTDGQNAQGFGRQNPSIPYHGTDVMRRSLEEKMEKHIGEVKERLAIVTAHWDEITTHTGAIRELGSQLNALLPICRLPPEILSEVFLEYAAPYESEALPDDSPLIVTQVCRHWRTVALNCPRLWTSVDLSDPPQLIKEFFARAKQAPLTIGGESPPPLEIQQILAPELHRIEFLHLKLPEGKLRRRGNVITAVPLLRKLYLSGGPAKFPDTLYLKCFSDILYGDAAPRLQELDIRSGIPFTWDPKFLHPNMKNLHIHSISQTTCSLTNILIALGAMPLLEQVRLISCLPTEIPLPCPGGRIVSLPRLRSISVFAATHTCANLLSYLAIPHDSSIGISGGLTLPFGPLELPMAKFTEHYPFQQLTVSDMHTFQFTPTTKGVEANYSISEAGDDLEATGLTIGINGNGYHEDAAFVPLCHCLPLAGVVKLVLVDPYWDSNETLTLSNALRRMHNVHVLELHDFWSGCYKPFLTALMHVQGRDGFVLPQLRELVLSRVHLGKERDIDMLVNHLKKRRDSGHGVQKLILTIYCPPDDQLSDAAAASIVPRFEQVVTQVIWKKWTKASRE